MPRAGPVGGATADRRDASDRIRPEELAVPRSGIERLERRSRRGPTRIKPRVHEKNVPARLGTGKDGVEGQRPERGEQCFRVRSAEEVVERVVPAASPAGSDADRVHVVISENAPTAHAPKETQDLGGMGTAVDEIPGAPDRVAVLVESNRCEETLERPDTPVNITDDPTHAAHDIRARDRRSGPRC